VNVDGIWRDVDGFCLINIHKSETVRGGTIYTGHAVILDDKEGHKAYVYESVIPRRVFRIRINKWARKGPEFRITMVIEKDWGWTSEGAEVPSYDM